MSMTVMAEPELTIHVLAGTQSARIVWTFLNDWLIKNSLTGEAGDIRLVVDELVVNAAQACTREDRITVTVTRLHGGVLVQVQDRSPALPVQPPPVVELELEDLDLDDPDGNGGRGLQIVAALSAAYGLTPLAEGKIIWARLTT